MQKLDQFRWIVLMGVVGYLLTLATPFGLENYDAFELLLAAKCSFAAHSPGYTIYLWCLKGFATIMGLLSIEFALAGVYFNFACFIITAILIYKLAGQIRFEWAFVIFCMLCSPVFVDNLLQVEVYVFEVLLMCSVFAAYFSERGRDRLFFLLSGLWMSHRLIAILPLIPFLLVRFQETRKRNPFLIGYFFVFPLLHFVLLHIGLNGSKYVSCWPAGNANSWMLSLLHFLGSIYSESVDLSFPSLERLAQFWFSLGVALGLLSLLLLFVPRHRRWKPFFIAFIFSLVFPVFYSVPDFQVFLLIPIVLLLVSFSPDKNSPISRYIWFAPLLVLLFQLGNKRDPETVYFYRAVEQKIKDARWLNNRRVASGNTIFAAYDSIFALNYFDYFFESNGDGLQTIPLAALYDDAHYARMVKNLSLKQLNLDSGLSNTTSLDLPTKHLNRLANLSKAFIHDELWLPGDKLQTQNLLNFSSEFGLDQLGSVCMGYWIRFGFNLTKENPLSFIYLSSHIKKSESAYLVHFQFSRMVNLVGYEVEIVNQAGRKIRNEVPVHQTRSLKIGLPRHFKRGEVAQVLLFRNGEFLGQSALLLD